MSLFDSVVAFAGNALAASSDPRAAMLQSVLGAMQHHEGGLGGLLAQLQQGGLGDAVASWIGNGQNQPVSADALQNALGSDKLAAIAAKLGMSPDTLGAHLSEMLPQVVNHLTPGGEVEEGGFDLGKLGSLLEGAVR